MSTRTLLDCTERRRPSVQTTVKAADAFAAPTGCSCSAALSLQVGAVRVHRVGVDAGAVDLPRRAPDLRGFRRPRLAAAGLRQAAEAQLRVHLPVPVGRDAQQVAEAPLAQARRVEVRARGARDEQPRGDGDGKHDPRQRRVQRDLGIAARRIARDQAEPFTPSQRADDRGAGAGEGEAGAQADHGACQAEHDDIGADHDAVNAPVVAEREQRDPGDAQRARRERRDAQARLAQQRPGDAIAAGERQTDADQQAASRGAHLDRQCGEQRGARQHAGQATAEQQAMAQAPKFGVCGSEWHASACDGSSGMACTSARGRQTERRRAGGRDMRGVNASRTSCDAPAVNAPARRPAAPPARGRAPRPGPAAAR
jgi:hypothetical protein